MRPYALLTALLLGTSLLAQTPQAFNYQGVARDAGGDELVNTAIGVQFQLHQGTAVGTVVYSETHSPTTNELGLFSLEVGNGTPGAGTFAAIDWSAGPYFLEVGLDPAGGSSYTSVGTQQLLSVPYALHSRTADMADDGDWVLSGDTVHSNGRRVGIGTSAPTHLLNVKRNGQGFSQNSANDNVRVGTYTDNNNAYIQTHSDHPLHFATNNALAQVSLLQNGDLGIGTTTPEARLDVAGTFKLSDGTQGDKKILTSDADGNASWQDLSPLSLYGENAPSTSFACMNEVGITGVDSAPNDVEVSGDHAYVIDPLTGNLQVIAISNPAAPSAVGSLTLTGFPFRMRQSGAFLYVLKGASGELTVVDISTPTNPVARGSVSLGAGPSDVAVEGAYAYVVSNTSDQLYVIDVSDPDAPFDVGGGYALGTGPVGIEVQGGLAYVIDLDTDDLKVIDVSTPAAPAPVGSVGIGTQPIAIALQGDHAYVVDLGSTDLKVIDVGLPGTPAVVGSVNVGPAPLAIEVVGDFAFVVDQNHQELKVFDVSVASAPSNEEALGVGPLAQDVAIQGNYAYVISDGDNALRVIELTCQTGVGYTPLGGFSTLQEDDPQVGQFVVNAVPRWNGESLNLGSIYDTGIGNVTVPHSAAMVGIGTSTPSAKLDVRDATASEFRLSLSSSHWGKFRFSASEGLRIEAKHETVEFRPMLLIGSELRFMSGVGTTPERMRLTSNGYLGIGTNNPAAHLEVNGYTKLGTDAPAIKQKVLTGNFPNAGGSTSIPHGLNADKILSVDILIKFGGSHYPPEGLSSYYRFTSTNILLFSTGTSTLPDGSPLRILITYQE